LKLQAFLRAQHAAFGFREVITPIIYKQSLWETSGHWTNYADDMFTVTGRGATGSAAAEPGQDESFGLKPMNCPGHCLLFKSQHRSYRDLPIRYADFSPLHRNEISGALSGLTRVRRFHQDDGHIFCRPSQVGIEIERTLQMVGMIYNTFGLGPYKLVLSTRPAQHMGTTAEWDVAEAQLRTALENSGREWTTNAGDGAFYGPKIDIILADSDGKHHQTATVQLDFQLPQRFGLTYAAPAAALEARGESTTDARLLAEAGEVTPVIIHRAVLGSLERFMALLIEHYHGRWPFWLSPRQAIIVTVGQADATLDYAASLARELDGSELGPATEAGGLPRPRGIEGYSFTVEVDASARSVAKKIAEAKTKHHNLICVVGPKEAAEQRVVLDFEGSRDVDAVRGLCEEVGGAGGTRQMGLERWMLGMVMQGLCDRYL
jgi:threonyl-tRNA synthetase